MSTDTEAAQDTPEAEAPPPLVEVPKESEPAEAHPAALLVGVLLLVLLGVISSVRLMPPAVKPADAPADTFSGARAMAMLTRILGENPVPHPFGSAANAKVRERLIAELKAIGYTPTLHETFVNSSVHGNCGTVKNVLARIDGRNPDGKMTILVAHYDSVASGIGASDDGAGVATILEVARALKAGPQPANPVGFVFTDGEECGLLGAEGFVAEHPWMKQVGFVINLEARGSRGPSLMFETSPNNAEIVKRFAQVSPRPITGSSFTTVYELMPNDTDFTPFKKLESPPPGINLAYIGGVHHYHTNLDDLEHIDPRSVQHHGDNTLALARSLGETPLAESKGDAVFFDLFGLTVIRWPASLTPVVCGLALLLVLVAAVLPARGGRAAKVAESVGTGVLTVAIALVGSLGAVHLLAGRLIQPDQTPWPAEPGALIVCLGAAALSIQALIGGLLGQRSGFWGTWSATWLVWAGIGLGLSFKLPGFTFLFAVPAIVAGLAGIAANLFGRDCRTSAAAAALLPLVAAGCVWLPTLLLMYDALGVGRQPTPKPITLYSFALFLTALLPLLALRSRTRHSSALLFASLSLVLIAGVGNTRAQRYSVDPLRAAGKPPLTGRPYQLDAPRSATYAFVQDTQTNTAKWLVFGAGRDLPEFLRSAPQAFSERPRRDLPWLPWGAWSADAVPRNNAKPPTLEGLTSKKVGKGRVVTARLRSPRGANQVVLMLGPQTPLGAIKIGGKPATVVSVEGRAWRTVGHHVYWCFTAPPDGVPIELTLTSDAKVKAVILDAFTGLPPSGKILEDLREPLGSPWGRWADLWVHSAEVEF